MSIYQCDHQMADELKPGITSLRVIIGSMAAGAVAFLVVATCMRLAGAGKSPTETMSLLRWVAIGMAPIAFIASRVLAASVVESARRRLVAGTFQSGSDAGSANRSGLAELGDAGALFGVYTTRAIISAGCLELATFACIVSFMFTGSLASLALSLALVCGIVANCPLAATSVAEWIEEQVRWVEEERTRVR